MFNFSLNELFSFNADVHFNDKKQKMSLHPQMKSKEDYVQSELRRLKQNLRATSAKMRRPPQYNLTIFLIFNYQNSLFLSIVNLMNHLYTMI